MNQELKLNYKSYDRRHVVDLCNMFPAVLIILCIYKEYIN